MANASVGRHFGPRKEVPMRLTFTLSELARLSMRELLTLRFRRESVFKTSPCSPERHAITQSLTNIRFVLTRRYMAPR